MKNSLETNIYFDELFREFENAFGKFKSKKIVLYGMGAFSAAIIEKLDYNIIGVLDRDADNIGKSFFNTNVISIREAEESADLIIINTQSSYWQLIYKRIKDIKIPVYFRNGQKAFLERNCDVDRNLEYWKYTKEDFIRKLDDYDVVSFDIFDTLVCRKIYLPSDVFLLIEKELKSNIDLDIEFNLLRNQAVNAVEYNDAKFDDIYEKFEKISGLDKSIVNKIKNYEKSVEKRLIIPRDDIIDVLKYCKECDKTVVLLSDMYYTEYELKEILTSVGIVDYDEIFVSCDLKQSKKSGTIYDLLIEYCNGRSVIHIGDNYNDDIVNAAKKNIDTFYIMSSRDMLANSSMKTIIPEILTLTDSIVVGNIISKLFNSPFALSENKGVINFKSPYVWGYSVFAPFILGYIHWMLKDAVKNNKKQILFFARDGYFLKSYFDSLLRNYGLEDKISAEYFYISRRLAIAAAIETEDDFYNFAKLPYVGNLKDYLDKRWGVKSNKASECKSINSNISIDELKNILAEYMQEIKESLYENKINYRKYCDRVIKDNFAISDLWYNGTCQYYLSKFLSKKVDGYYFVANNQENNINYGINTQKSCYTLITKVDEQEINILDYSLHFESVITSPHGMVKKCIDNGMNFIYEKKSQNQINFNMRIEIDRGIKDFIEDYYNSIEDIHIEKSVMNYSFLEKLYALVFKNGAEIGENIKKKLFNENFFQDDNEYLVEE